ncbi:MAG: FAD-dependent oxidoreductase [Candidatus Pacebacteria bacterium]|nr:FAD-dependent oxidoreductase [Candidatus Paceibacterota bacterium]
MVDLVIIGGGPAGVTAGVYAARKKMKAVLITDNFGGQSIVSEDIQNWIGIKSIAGFDLARDLEDQLRAQKGLEIIDGDLVVKVEKAGEGFAVSTQRGKTIETKTILVCSGSGRRKLGVKGEGPLNGKGVAYCSICDAPLFKDKIVAVIGGGNAGLESVRDLLQYSKKIYLMEFLDVIKGDAVTFENIKKDPKVEVIMSAAVQEILGDNLVSGLKYQDRKTNEIKELKLDGVFVEIGSTPSADFLGDLVQKNQYKEITVDCLTQKTSQEGIWAAGDVSSGLYKQNNIAVGDACKAVLNIYDYLSSQDIGKK